MPATFRQECRTFFCLSRDVSIEEAMRIAGGNAEYIQSFGRCGGFLSPCISVLPMGFNWSFFLVQALHEQSACRSLGIDRDAVILDGRPQTCGGQGAHHALL